MPRLPSRTPGRRYGRRYRGPRITETQETLLRDVSRAMDDASDLYERVVALQGNLVRAGEDPLVYSVLNRASDLLIRSAGDLRQVFDHLRGRLDANPLDTDAPL